MYTVSWSPATERELAEIWNNAPDRVDVTAAANELDAALVRDPLTFGEARGGSTRIAFVKPLAVLFDVNEANQPKCPRLGRLALAFLIGITLLCLSTSVRSRSHAGLLLFRRPFSTRMVIGIRRLLVLWQRVFLQFLQDDLHCLLQLRIVAGADGLRVEIDF